MGNILDCFYLRRIIDVVASRDYSLQVTYDNNVVKTYDIKPLINKSFLKEDFKSLDDVDRFVNDIRIAPFGCGVEWPDGVNISQFRLSTYAVELTNPVNDNEHK